MEFKTEVEQAIATGFEEFQRYIQQKIEANPYFLQEMHWMPDGSQMNLVNVLIDLHKEPVDLSAQTNETPVDLTHFILWVLMQSTDKNRGDPLHQLIKAQKVQLALKLLREYKPKTQESPSKPQSVSPLSPAAFDYNRRDCDGSTLLALAMDLKNNELLTEILACNPDIHSSVKRGTPPVFLQPLHQAVISDNTEATRLLIKAAAQLTNPAGPSRETPLLLAACAGAVDSLEALLDQPLERLQIEAENTNINPELKTGHQAIEVLCQRMAEGKEKSKALRGVVMLLCHGAEPPRDTEMRAMLSDNRGELLKIAQNYLDSRPDLVDDFVKRCHQYGSALHGIVYADHSWGSAMRRLFGRPSDAAFLLENLISKKYREDNQPQPALKQGRSADDKENLKLYAEFVRRYKLAYDSQYITNSWSTMRWMIAEGRCNWEIVQHYVKSNPKSRANRVYNEMISGLEGNNSMNSQAPDNNL